MNLADRINRLPKWAREFIHNIETFVGAEEVQELTFFARPEQAAHQAGMELPAGVFCIGKEMKAENRLLNWSALTKPAATFGFAL